MNAYKPVGNHKKILPNNMTEKNNRIALVTGVSRLKGIGKAICTELAKNSIDIFFTYWLNYDKQMDWGVAENEPDNIQEEIQEHDSAFYQVYSRF